MPYEHSLYEQDGGKARITLNRPERLYAAIGGSRLLLAPDQTYFREHREELMNAVAEFLRGGSATK
jgi:hypothetical protein